MSATVFVYEFNEEKPSLILQGETLSDALISEYPQFPKDAILYKGREIADDQRVLFLTEEEKQEMAFATGEFTLTFSPNDPITIIVGVVVGALALFALSSLVPKIPNIAGGAGQFDSSNNSLTERENQQRIGGLVPEIFGTQRATPDLIQLPYSVYVDNKEVEYAVMCLGRGRYEIDTNEIYDDTTRLKGVAGSILDVYEANFSPLAHDNIRKYGTNSTDKYDDVPWNVKKCNSVNGQTLKGWQSSSSENRWTDTFIIESKGITSIVANFVWPQGIYFTNESNGTLTAQSITTEVGIRPVDASGTTLSGYSEVIYSLTRSGGVSGSATLRSQQNETLYCNVYQSWWIASTTYPIDTESNATTKARMILARSAILAVYCENIDPSTPLHITRIKKNHTATPARGDQVLVASFDGTNYGIWGGNYTNSEAAANEYANKDERPIWVKVKKYTAFSAGTPNTDTFDTSSNQVINILIDYRMLADSGTTAAPVELATDENYLRLRSNVFYGGGFDRVAVRFRRVNQQLYPNYTDETKIKDCFARSPIKRKDFGDVTTVYSKTFATEGALALKKRKLNMTVTRQIPLYKSTGEYVTSTGTVYSGSTPPYVATNRIDHILVNILKDPLLGAIPHANIDFNNLYTLTNEMSDYFASGPLTGTGSGYTASLKTTGTGFNYTYDKTDMSLQEMLQIACSVNHMIPYRELAKFKFLFEGSIITPKLLFNCRNKVPNTQVRTVTFGAKESYDGVEVPWKNPETSDSLETFKIPYDGSAQNPLKIDLVGIRNERQAFRHAYRAYYSIFQKNVVDEFEALPEAQILVRGHRIYSADNTRSEVLEGEVETVSGNVLTLSQPADLSGLTNPYIYLQHRTGTVQSLPITQGTNNYKVVFTGTLSTSLVTDPDYYANTLYQIWGETDTREKSFLVDERSPTGDSGTQRIKATVYNPMIYIADKMTFWFQPLDQNWIDRTPNKRTPIPRAGAYILSDPSNKRGYCYYNNTTTSYLTFATADPVQLGTTFTIMAWIKMIPAGSTRPHFIVPTTNGTSFILQIYENAVSGVFSLQAIRTNTASAGIPNATTQWNHIAVTFSDTNVMRIYINGEKVDEVTSTAMTPTRPIYIGGHPSFTANSFKGYMDGLIISYDTLPSSVIRDFYLFEKNITNSTKY